MSHRAPRWALPARQHLQRGVTRPLGRRHQAMRQLGAAVAREPAHRVARLRTTQLELRRRHLERARQQQERRRVGRSATSPGPTTCAIGCISHRRLLAGHRERRVRRSEELEPEGILAAQLLPVRSPCESIPSASAGSFASTTRHPGVRRSVPRYGGSPFASPMSQICTRDGSPSAPRLWHPRRPASPARAKVLMDLAAAAMDVARSRADVGVGISPSTGSLRKSTTGPRAGAAPASRWCCAVDSLGRSGSATSRATAASLAALVLAIACRLPRPRHAAAVGRLGHRGARL